MVKYLGPRLRILKKLGYLPGLSQKLKTNKIKSPGEHGKFFITKNIRTTLPDDYKSRLLEKQKIKFNYGITEKQLIKYYKYSRKTKENLLQKIEMRLDCIVFRMGFATSIKEAKQLINHNNFLINNKNINISSYICKVGDIISVKEKAKIIILKNITKNKLKKEFILKKIESSNLLYKIFFPLHLKVNTKNLLGKIINFCEKTCFLIKINDLKVVEFYSR